MRLVLCLLACSTFPALARAEPARDARPSQAAEAPTASELDARVSALLQLPELDESVRRPAELARAALQRAQESAQAGDAVAEERTQRLARAGVELAEARLALIRERTLLKATQQRRATSFAERETARRALERERARVAELERTGVRP